MLSPQAKERLQTEPAAFIEEEIKAFARTSPLNRLSILGNNFIFDIPLVRFADGSDPIFAEYKTLIASIHFTPREVLAKAYGNNPEDMPMPLSVISWILPIIGKTRESNRSETIIPSRLWANTRW